MKKIVGICCLAFILLISCPSTAHSAPEELRGRIANLEVRPLSFVLHTNSGSYHVRTIADTQLARDGKNISTDVLQDGDYLWVLGKKGKDIQSRAAFTAVKIDIATVLSGTIQSIQTVLPLQLVVNDHDSKRVIHSSKNSTLTRDGKKVAHKKLRRGLTIWVAGSSPDDVFVAKNIEVVNMIEGEIVGIMEVFPLHLSVKTKTGEVTIQLREDTLVTRGKVPRIDPGQLQEHDVIRVTSFLSDGCLVAKEIALVDSKSK